MIRYAAVTNIGIAPANNEDNFYVDGNYRSDTAADCYSCSGESRSKPFIAAVCDGMGGEADGERASLAVVQTLKNYVDEKKLSSAGNVNIFIQEANGIICGMMHERHCRMGSTLAYLQIDGQKVSITNLGDSRIYGFGRHGLEQLSTDHSTVARMIQMGILTEEEARLHPNRHQITQYLGIYPEEMVLEPKVLQVDRQEKYQTYLLCSDGLTDMLMPQAIENVLAANMSLEEKANHLVQNALDAGGKDNITVILVEKVKTNLFQHAQKRKTQRQ